MNEPHMSSRFHTPHYTGGDNSSWKVFTNGPEQDPNGKSPHELGAKLDAGKIRPGLVLGGFARALLGQRDPALVSARAIGAAAACRAAFGDREQK